MLADGADANKHVRFGVNGVGGVLGDDVHLMCTGECSPKVAETRSRSSHQVRHDEPRSRASTAAEPTGKARREPVTDAHGFTPLPVRTPFSVSVTLRGHEIETSNPRASEAARFVIAGQGRFPVEGHLKG